MLKKGLKAALLAACVMGVTASVTHAEAPGLRGSFLSLIGGTTPPDPVTNPPGPRPPPKLDGGPKGTTPPPKIDGSDPVINPPGPKPPPR